jgi:Domain of unknown function (DUF4174)
MSTSKPIDRRSLLAAIGAATLLAPGAHAMNDYQWKKRPIVIFSPSENDARLIRQRAIINGNRTSFLDREVVVVYVVGSSMTHDLGAGPGMSGSALRSRFRVSEGSFRVLLVGKDGGVKLDSPQPVSASDVFNEIDRMPMRRDEIRRRANEKS